MARVKTATLVREIVPLFESGTMRDLGDGQLLERFIAGRDELAFEELVARHGPVILGICRRSLDDPRDVEDAFQATFLLLVRKAASLRDRETVSSWLYGVALRITRRA
ncbi:RNA polymerase sigma factor, partial [Singulisphaera rosea]